MNILVVTSDVTFVPNNYRDFLTHLFKELEIEMAQSEVNLEVAILKNNSFSMIFKALAFYLMGAKNIGRSLLINSIRARFNDKKEFASTLKKPIHYFLNPNTDEFINFVKAHEIDLIINARTRYIYKKKILKAPKLACLNIHHGLLPDYRGTMCDLWALDEDRPTGFSIHVMEKKIDDGAIVRRIQTSKPGEVKDYAQLIKNSSMKEGLALGKLIRELKDKQNIPIECENKTDNARYTQNPDFKAIKKILAKGIKL